MKITLITLGKPNLPFVKIGLEEYIKRIPHFVSFQMKVVKEGEKEEKKVLKLCEKKFLILLDEKGKNFSSIEFASFLENRMMLSQDICFLVAGPDGPGEKLRERADFLFSLSRLTFPHDMGKFNFIGVSLSFFFDTF